MNENSTRLDEYIRFFDTLSPGSLQHLARFFTDDARFKDPFNDVTGLAAIRHVFEHMFRVTARPSFAVTEAMESGDTALLRWVFTCRIRRYEIAVTGVSFVLFANDGRVREHIDYWDPAEGIYDRLPVIGALLRWLRRRLAA